MKEIQFKFRKMWQSAYIELYVPTNIEGFVYGTLFCPGAYNGKNICRCLTTYDNNPHFYTTSYFNDLIFISFKQFKQSIYEGNEI